MGVPPFGSAPTPSATTTKQGKVKLAGDLAGTADLPTVTDLTIASEAQGDILYRNATNWVRLPKGTASQEIRMNSGATAPEWYTPSASGSSIYHTFARVDQDSVYGASPVAKIVSGTGAAMALNTDGYWLAETSTSFATDSAVGFVAKQYAAASSVLNIFDRKIAVSAIASFAAIANNTVEVFIGFYGGTTVATNANFPLSMTSKHIGFSCIGSGSGAGVWHATNANGTTRTNTVVTVSIGDLNYHRFFVDYNGGTDAKFYVDGTLVATHTTNLPSGATGASSSFMVLIGNTGTQNGSQNKMNLLSAECAVAMNA